MKTRALKYLRRRKIDRSYMRWLTPPPPRMFPTSLVEKYGSEVFFGPEAIHRLFEFAKNRRE